MLDFSPIPDLRVPNSGVVLLSLVSLVGYTEEVLDPWFLAPSTTHKNLTGSNWNFLNSTTLLNSATIFLLSRVMSIIGCTEQYQFCSNTDCSKLNGLLANS